MTTHTKTNRVITFLLMTLILAISLMGCAANGAKETVGTVLGAGLGGLAGSFVGDGRGQLLAIAAGTLAGAFLGNEVGKSLDRADQLAMHQTEQHTLEQVKTGQTGQWHNPDSGNSGSITPTRTFQAQSGVYCREFQSTVVIGGEEHKSFGVACRQPDGHWRIQG